HLRSLLSMHPPRTPLFPYTTLFRSLSDVWVIEQYELHSLNEHLSNGRPWDLDRTYGGLQVLPPNQREHGEEEGGFAQGNADAIRSEEHTSELQSRSDLVCRLLLEKK